VVEEPVEEVAQQAVTEPPAEAATEATTEAPVVAEDEHTPPEDFTPAQKEAFRKAIDKKVWQRKEAERKADAAEQALVHGLDSDAVQRVRFVAPCLIERVLPVVDGVMQFALEAVAFPRGPELDAGPERGEPAREHAAITSGLVAVVLGELCGLTVRVVLELGQVEGRGLRGNGTLMRRGLGASSIADRLTEAGLNAHGL